jgi:cell division protein FtsX
VKSIFKIIKLNLHLTLLVSILYLIFFIYCGSFILFENYFENWEENLKVRIFLSKDIDKTLLNQIEEKLQDFYEIEKVNFISGDTIKKELEERFNSLSGIIAFSDSYELTPQKKYRNLKGLKNISFKLKAIKGIDEVEYGQDWIYNFNSLMKNLRLILLIGGVFLLGLITVSLFFSFKMGFTPPLNKGFSGLFIGFIASLFALLLFYSIFFTLYFLIQNKSMEPYFDLVINSFYYQALIMLFGGTIWGMGCGLVTGKFKTVLNKYEFF